MHVSTMVKRKREHNGTDDGSKVASPTKKKKKEVLRESPEKERRKKGGATEVTVHPPAIEEEAPTTEDSATEEVTSDKVTKYKEKAKAVKECLRVEKAAHEETRLGFSASESKMKELLADLAEVTKKLQMVTDH